MLSSISWSDFIIAIATLSFIYYLFVIFRFYPTEVKAYIAGKGKLDFINQEGAAASVSKSPVEENSFDHASSDDDDREFVEVETLIGEIKQVITDNSDRNLVSQEFKQYLHGVLKNYPNISMSPLREAINELIISECEKYSVVTLSESELDGLWVSSV